MEEGDIAATIISGWMTFITVSAASSAAGDTAVSECGHRRGAELSCIVIEISQLSLEKDGKREGGEGKREKENVIFPHSNICN